MKEESKREKNTHKWLISALRWCQRPSWLCSLLGNEARWIDPWWDAVISLWSEHRCHKRTSILTRHHVRCSLLSRISSILLGEELLLGGHCGHPLMWHMLAIGGVGESRILRSQQLLEERKNTTRINKMQFKFSLHKSFKTSSS
jgi:hypothetical protein